MLTNMDVTLQQGHILHGFAADVTLQVLLEHIFCFASIKLQTAIRLQLRKGIRYVNEKRGSERVPVFLVLQCCRIKVLHSTAYQGYNGLNHNTCGVMPLCNKNCRWHNVMQHLTSARLECPKKQRMTDCLHSHSPYRYGQRGST